MLSSPIDLTPTPILFLLFIAADSEKALYDELSGRRPNVEQVNVFGGRYIREAKVKGCVRLSYSEFIFIWDRAVSELKN